MEYILIQPDEFSISLSAIKKLVLTSECLFHLSLDGPPLLYVLFEYLSNIAHEWNCHSFVKGGVCGR